MCILILKPKGAKFPTIEAITNSVNNNPDGFALAYNAGGAVQTYKTMSAKRFINKYRRLAATLDPGTTAMMIHARIATHGTIGVKNCHCWKSFDNTADEIAFAHNGILSIPNRDDMTDSETFLRDYFEPAYIRGGWAAAVQIIVSKIGMGKFGFIDRDGGIRKFGSFFNEAGCHFSNTSYARCGNARTADPRYWGFSIHAN